MVEYTLIVVTYLISDLSNFKNDFISVFKNIEVKFSY